MKSFLSDLLEEKERSEGKPCVAALSSVRRNDKELDEFLSGHAGKRFLNVSWRDKELKKDFPILKEMPDGMGADRMAHIVAACEMFKGENVIVMDLGTAITVEFIAADGHYQGGNISIGLNTRYKALHKYCAKIPLVKPPLVRKAGRMLIGYAWGSTRCGGNEIESRAPYWVACDYMQRAKNADPSLTPECNDMIAQYSKFFPAAADAFMYDVTNGQSYTVSCGGMSETTTVRTVK